MELKFAAIVDAIGLPLVALKPADISSLADEL
jgi:hypothetical protein